MSSRTQLNPYPVIKSGDLTTTVISDVTIIQKLSLVSYSVTWAGSSPSATISVEVSNDFSLNPDGSVNNPGTWTNLPLSTTPVISGNTGNGVIDIESIPSYAIRLVSTPISGTGVINALVTGKVS